MSTPSPKFCGIVKRRPFSHRPVWFFLQSFPGIFRASARASPEADKGGDGRRTPHPAGTRAGKAPAPAVYRRHRGFREGGVRKIYRHAAPDAAEWLVCRFGTPPGRAVSLWGLSERMAFSLESAGGVAAPLSTADKKSIYPNSEIPMKKM